MKIKCFLSIIIYMAVAKQKRVGMLMQTAKDTLTAGINRQAHSVTYTDRLAYCETETDRAFTPDTQTHRDRQARTHTLFCDACWLNQCRNILTRLFGRLLHSKIQPDSDIPQQKVFNEYKQYV